MFYNKMYNHLSTLIFTPSLSVKLQNKSKSQKVHHLNWTIFLQLCVANYFFHYYKWYSLKRVKLVFTPKEELKLLMGFIFDKIFLFNHNPQNFTKKYKTPLIWTTSTEKPKNKIFKKSVLYISVLCALF